MAFNTSGSQPGGQLNIVCNIYRSLHVHVNISIVKKKFKKMVACHVSDFAKGTCSIEIIFVFPEYIQFLTSH